MRILGKNAIPLLVAFTLVGAGCRADLEMGRGGPLEILEQEPVPLESLIDQKD